MTHNSKPITVPSFREWNSGEESFVLTPSTRMVVAVSNIAPTVAAILPELQRITSFALPLEVGSEPQAGDIFLTLDGADPGLGREGYSLTISNGVRIAANALPGLFYGLQTIRQILEQQCPRLPCGTARDYPAFAQRGLMLDVGRKYWSVDYLKSLMQEMARLKLNMLHLHFTEWSAFRLYSEQHPSLVTEPCYSRADLIDLQKAAEQYHILLVPEVDLPAHATAITRYHPSLAFTCNSMSYSRWPGGEYGGWTINYADPVARQWMKELLTEFIPLFAGPYFHIGCDEVPEGDDLANSPKLVTYARDRGYAYPGDVLVEWINEMNAFVKSYGKQMQMWNWYERSPHSIEADRDILINAWTNSETADQLVQAGYNVICSPEATHYVTPGLNLLPDPDYLAKTWTLNPRMTGYKICVWTDRCEDQPDTFFEDHLRLPRTILAERTWTNK